MIIIEQQLECNEFIIIDEIQIMVFFSYFQRFNTKQ